MKSERLIPASILPELLDYDPSTGLFVWRERPVERFAHMVDPEIRCRLWNGQFARKPALFAQHNGGYFSGAIFNMQVLAHRVAWAISHGAWPAGTIDHVNGDKRDNRLSNLRDVPHAQNMKNLRLRRNNRSGVNGVYWAEHAGKWRAEIKADGKRVHCGYFDSIEEAERARRQANERFGFAPLHGAAA